jgi:4-azaleucine resistance transporter AzlC
MPVMIYFAFSQVDDYVQMLFRTKCGKNVYMEAMEILIDTDDYHHLRAEFWAGARDTIPLIVGAIPFGVIYGTLAQQSGLSFAAALAMSIFVFAGSSQFIALGLLAAGTGWPMVVATTFVVNLRHLLYAATLLPFVKPLPRTWKAALSFWLTDETFVVAVKRYNQTDNSKAKHWYQLGSALSMYGNWQLCTLVGLTLGQIFPRIGSWGLDFAMPATFIGMVLPYLRSKPMWFAVGVSGLTAILTNSLPHKIGLMIAALAGVAAGIYIENILNNGKKKHE